MEAKWTETVKGIYWEGVHLSKMKKIELIAALKALTGENARGLKADLERRLHDHILQSVAAGDQISDVRLRLIGLGVEDGEGSGEEQGNRVTIPEAVSDTAPSGGGSPASEKQEEEEEEEGGESDDSLPGGKMAEYNGQVIADMPFRTLQHHLKGVGLKAVGSRDTLISRLEGYVKSLGSEGEEGDSSVKSDDNVETVASPRLSRSKSFLQSLFGFGSAPATGGSPTLDHPPPQLEQQEPEIGDTEHSISEPVQYEGGVISEMAHRTLQQHLKRLGLKAGGSRDALIGRLQNYVKSLDEKEGEGEEKAERHTDMEESGEKDTVTKPRVRTSLGFMGFTLWQGAAPETSGQIPDLPEDQTESKSDLPSQPDDHSNLCYKGEVIAEMSFRNLQLHLRGVGLKAGGARDDLVARLRSYVQGLDGDDPPEAGKAVAALVPKEQRSLPLNSDCFSMQAGCELSYYGQLVQDMSASELRYYLKEIGLPSSGSKADLVDRLRRGLLRFKSEVLIGIYEGESLEDMSVDQLKTVCRTEGLSIIGNRETLHRRLLKFLLDWAERDVKVVNLEEDIGLIEAENYDEDESSNRPASVHMAEAEERASDEDGSDEPGDSGNDLASNEALKFQQVKGDMPARRSSSGRSLVESKAECESVGSSSNDGRSESGNDSDNMDLADKEKLPADKEVDGDVIWNKASEEDVEGFGASMVAGSHPGSESEANDQGVVQIGSYSSESAEEYPRKTDVEIVNDNHSQGFTFIRTEVDAGSGTEQEYEGNELDTEPEAEMHNVVEQQSGSVNEVSSNANGGDAGGGLVQTWSAPGSGKDVEEPLNGSPGVVGHGRYDIGDKIYQVCHSELKVQAVRQPSSPSQSSDSTREPYDSDESLAKDGTDGKEMELDSERERLNRNDPIEPQTSFSSSSEDSDSAGDNEGSLVKGGLHSQPESADDSVSASHLPGTDMLGYAGSDLDAAIKSRSPMPNADSGHHDAYRESGAEADHEGDDEVHLEMETPVEAEDMDEGTLTDNSSASHEDHLSPRKISTPEAEDDVVDLISSGDEGDSQVELMGMDVGGPNLEAPVEDDVEGEDAGDEFQDAMEHLEDEEPARAEAARASPLRPKPIRQTSGESVQAENAARSPREGLGALSLEQRHRFLAALKGETTISPEEYKTFASFVQGPRRASSGSAAIATPIDICRTLMGKGRRAPEMDHSARPPAPLPAEAGSAFGRPLPSFVQREREDDAHVNNFYSAPQAHKRRRTYSPETAAREVPLDSSPFQRPAPTSSEQRAVAPGASMPSQVQAPATPLRQVRKATGIHTAPRAYSRNSLGTANRSIVSPARQDVPRSAMLRRGLPPMGLSRGIGKVPLISGASGCGKQLNARRLAEKAVALRILEALGGDSTSQSVGGPLSTQSATKLPPPPAHISAIAASSAKQDENLESVHFAASSSMPASLLSSSLNSAAAPVQASTPCLGSSVHSGEPFSFRSPSKGDMAMDVDTVSPGPVSKRFSFSGPENSVKRRRRATTGASESEVNVCGAAPQQAKVGAPTPAVAPNLTQATTSPVSGFDMSNFRKPGQWKCTDCYATNEKSSLKCACCNAAAPNSEKSSNAPSTGGITSVAQTFGVPALAASPFNFSAQPHAPGNAAETQSGNPVLTSHPKAQQKADISTSVPSSGGSKSDDAIRGGRSSSAGFFFTASDLGASADSAKASTSPWISATPAIAPIAQGAERQWQHPEGTFGSSDDLAKTSSTITGFKFSPAATSGAASNPAPVFGAPTASFSSSTAAISSSFGGFSAAASSGFSFGSGRGQDSAKGIFSASTVTASQPPNLAFGGASAAGDTNNPFGNSRKDAPVTFGDSSMPADPPPPSFGFTVSTTFGSATNDAAKPKAAVSTLFGTPGSTFGLALKPPSASGNTSSGLTFGQGTPSLPIPKVSGKDGVDAVDKS